MTNQPPSPRAAAGQACTPSGAVGLIATPGSADSLAKAVGRTHWLYAQYVNRLHGRCGHLWQNRFYSCGLDEVHFWTAMVYVEARPHPWVLSTTRHISQGGVSLLDESWDGGGKVLSGKSSVVIGDPYVMTVHIPKGFRLKSVEVRGEKVEFANQTQTATVRIVPSATKTMEWKMTFAK